MQRFTVQSCMKNVNKTLSRKRSSAFASQHPTAFTHHSPLTTTALLRAKGFIPSPQEYPPTASYSKAKGNPDSASSSRHFPTQAEPHHARNAD